MNGGVPERTLSPQATKDQHNNYQEKTSSSPTTSRRFPQRTCVLDGRNVHKELGRTWSNWSEGGAQRLKPEPTTSDSDQDLLQRIDSLLKEKNRVDVSYCIVCVCVNRVEYMYMYCIMGKLHVLMSTMGMHDY